MSSTMQRRIEALEAANMAKTRPLLLIVRFLVATEGEAEPVGIRAAPPYFPEPVDRLSGESWEAFTDRLESMLSHLPGNTVVRVFSRDECLERL